MEKKYNLRREGSYIVYERYEDGKVITKYLPIEFNYITEDIINFKKDNKIVIYDLNKGKIISNKFNMIYDYQDYNGQKIAKAEIYIRYGNRIITLSCFIDIYGNIVSKVIDNKDLMPFNSELLDNHIKFLRMCLKDEEEQFLNILKNEEQKLLLIKK